MFLQFKYQLANSKQPQISNHFINFSSLVVILVFGTLIFHINTSINQFDQYLNLNPMKISQSQNYLLSGRKPLKTTENMYEHEKTIKTEFSTIAGEQTHTLRRKKIMDKYPQIKKLFVLDKSYTVWISLLIIPLNFGIIYMAKDAPLAIFLLSAFILTSTLTHCAHVLIHDLTHNLGHKSPLVNKLLAIYANLPFPLPIAISFGKYHAEHHRQIGLLNKDPDLPLLNQALFVKKWYIKIFYVIFLTAVYAVRPLFSVQLPITKLEALNILVIFVSDFVIYKYWGIWALVYMLTASFFSIGLHPASLHVMAEHYEFVKGMETYNYIGFWNYLNLNVGYHIQHHDFPHCPWYNLPKISKIAPEFYENLPYHTSYFKLMLKFIFDDKFTLFNRTIRIPQNS